MNQEATLTATETPANTAVLSTTPSRGERITTLLTWLLKTVSLVLGLGSSPVMQILPPKYGAYALVLFGFASWLKDGIYMILDLLDDGKINKSVILKAIPVGILVFLCFISLSACAGVNAAGEKTRGGLTGAQWSKVGKTAGNIAITATKAAALTYLSEKNPIPVQPSTTYQSEGEVEGGWLSGLVNLFQ